MESLLFLFFFSSRRRHTRYWRDWSSDVCSSDLGHSVGAHVLLKYLSEEEVEKPVAGLFLVAAPYVGPGGWEVEEGALREDFASKLPEGLPVFLYHGREDEVVPLGHLALFEAKLPRATVRGFDGLGHQFDDDLSEVAGDIEASSRPTADRSREGDLPAELGRPARRRSE